VRDLFGPPLAIEPAPPGPASPGVVPNGHGPSPTTGPFVGAASVPSPVPTSVPLRVHTPAASGIELRTGYGLSATAAPADGVDLVRATRTTRLDRRVRIRSRWSTEDEFRQAARAELFSDDARYRVLFALTAGWYGPVALIYLIWVVLISGDGGSGVIGALLWLAAAAGVSLGVAGLLRWASVGWRALSLSAAAAIIGGGITTIAHTLTG
jgi:hypothetical protein